MADTLTLVRCAVGEITIVRSLTADETDQYQAALEHLREFDVSPQYLELVARNQVEFQDAIAKWRASAKELQGNRDLQASLQIEVNRRLINYLSTARLLLDHYEMRLKRRYGDKSEQVIGFKTATAASFDGHFAYRFLYTLRNYAQHFGVPATHVDVSGRQMSPEGGDVTYSAEISLDRGDLLRHGRKVWKTLADEVAALPVLVDVEPYVSIMTQELNRVVAATQASEREALLATATRLSQIMKDAIAKDATPGCALIRGGDGKTTFEFVQPPFRLMQWLGIDGFERPLF